MRRPHLPGVGSGTATATDVDRGWSWVTLAATFTVHFIYGGQLLSTGVFYVALLEYHTNSRAGNTAAPAAEHEQQIKVAVAWPGSINLSSMTAFSLLASFCVIKFGCRVTVMSAGVIFATGLMLSALTVQSLELHCITYGLITGLGGSLSYVPTICAANENFLKYRSMAVSVTITGAAVGSIVVPPLQVELISEYGLRGALLLNAGVVLHCCVCGALLFPKRTLLVRPCRASDTDFIKNVVTQPPALLLNYPEDEWRLQENVSTKEEYREVTEWESEFGTAATELHSEERGCRRLTIITTIVRAELRDWINPHFAKFMLSNFLAMGGYAIHFTFNCDYTISKGLSHEDAALLVSVFGICGITGRLLPIAISSCKSASAMKVYSLSCLLAAVCSLSFGFSDEHLTLGVFSGGLGLSYGMYSTYTALASDLLGSQKTTKVLGYSNCVIGIGSLFMPILAGYIADALFSLVAVIYTCSVLHCLAFCISLCSILQLRSTSNKDLSYHR